eukprot:TRINITY_DN58862_c0_g1_i1.p2 TRINITY_DN58862_c0_g1~~TRINITY_DN58862_c0_g1_i1.p2  ORF type:complete len:640 (+),score=291.32 TRINITY_DN58862_c0_g1_i1:46-1965(+)
MASATMHAVALLLLCGAGVTTGFYLPGAKPKEYAVGENIPMFVNSMSSVNTHLPFDYYSLPFCKPTGNTKGKRESLGEILMGDRIKASPYEGIFVGKDFQCKVVCDPQPLKPHQRARFERYIDEEYMMQLILDGLPVAVHNPDSSTYSVGFPLGGKDSGKEGSGKEAYINNHLQFTIKYTKVRAFEGDDAKGGEAGAQDANRIVAFTVKPYSVKHKVQDGQVPTCADGIDPVVMGLQYAKGEEPVAWTYGVKWEESEEKWGARWDVFLNVGDTDIHWFSIFNSVMIAFFLSGILAAIMLRTLLRDIARYNAIEDADDLNDETGWKLVHSDVFRPPARKQLLAVYVGTGVQLLGMCFTVLIMACLGFLSPASGGSLFTPILLFFVFLGICGGYTSARLMKMWGEHSWWTAFQTATHVPGMVFTAFFIINLFVWHEESTGAVPFNAMIAVLAIWCFISVPQVFLGAILGYRKDALKVPARINQITRFIPEQRWYLQPWFTIMCGGVLPFGAVFIELFFILTSIWMHRYYYVFGFLLLIFIILCITCAEITIVMCYFQLCAEDYHWWWRSFFTSGASGVYVFLYSIFYFFTSSLRMTRFTAILLFFGYMAVISYIFFVITGTIGFIACFWFVRKIYSSIKID